MADDKFGVPTEAQLAKINRFAKKKMTADDVFAFPVKMVGDAEVPGRNLRLDKSLLTEFAKQAKGGNVAYMMNHRWSAWFGMADNKGPMNVGRVYDSWVADAHDIEGETAAQFGEVYIPRGAVKDGVNTDEVIQSIEDGTQFDVSIGFGFKMSECSICKNNIRSPKCEHIPGGVYEGVKCIVVAKPPGDEFEVSGVFAGAYPTAGMLGVNGAEASTDSTPSMEEVADGEALKRVPEGVQVFAAFNKGGLTMWVPKGATKASFSIAPKQDEGGDGVSEWDKFGEEAEKHGLTAEQATEVLTKVVGLSTKRSVGVMELAASLDGLGEAPATGGAEFDGGEVKKALGKEYDAGDVLRFAKDGLALRESVINDCVAMRVRAQGNAFDSEAYKASLHKGDYSIDELRDLTEGFGVRAGEALNPGRHTVPAPLKEDKTALKSHVPAEAYMVRK